MKPSNARLRTNANAATGPASVAGRLGSEIHTPVNKS
jgi:hypothetical protein